MTKRIKVLFVLLFISSLTTVVASCEEQYNHILTIEPPEPSSGLWFGYKVDIVGDKIITSEPYAKVEGYSTAGRVRIFDLDGNLLSTIQSPDPGPRVLFGSALSYNEDKLVIFEGKHIGEVRWVGKVYVHSIDGSFQFEIPPRREHKLTMNFGKEVEVSDTKIYIMEKGVDVQPLVAGMVHVYDREGTFLYTVNPPEPKGQHYFGNNIETHNGRVYISEYGDTYSSEYAGLVYVFDEDGNHIRTLESPEPEENAIFGSSLSISDDYIVVGEPWTSVDGETNAGKVHIFNHDGDLLRTLLSPVPELGAQFGWNVKVSGDTLVIGETNANVGDEGDEGKAYVFDVNGGLLQTIISPDPTMRGYFGWYIDIEGDLLAISELWAEVDGNSDCGSIHLYKLGPPLVAVFEVSNLVIDPVSVKVGESVTISVDVMNTGTKAGKHTVSFVIDGVSEDVQEIFLDVDQREQVSFMVEDGVEGSYSVDVNGLTGSYEVTKPIIPGYPLWSIGLSILLITVILSLKQRH